MIRIAICDDDIIIAEELKKILDKSEKLQNQFHVISIFRSKEDLLYEIEEKHNFDILFMDIEVGEANGIEVVKELKESCPYISVIYITSHSKYVYNVFETGPVGFVKKPFDKKDVYKYLDIAIDKMENSDFLLIKIDGGMTKLKIDDIMHIYSEARQVVFIVKNGKEYRIYGKLDDYEKELLEYKQLMRIHKSHIVNFDYVKKYEKTKLTLYDHSICSISRERREMVQEYLVSLMK